MATDSTKVRVGVTGEVSVAPSGSTLPTTAAGALDAAFKGLGYVSEDGVTETRDRSTDTIKAWQNSDTVRTVVTDATLTFQFALLETKKEVVEAFYGATVTSGASDGNFVIVPANTGNKKAWVIDVIDGTELYRIIIPSGEVTEVGDRVYSNGEPIGYDMTITAYASASISGSAKVYATALKT